MKKSQGWRRRLAAAPVTSFAGINENRANGSRDWLQKGSGLSEACLTQKKIWSPNETHLGQIGFWNPHNRYLGQLGFWSPKAHYLGQIKSWSPRPYPGLELKSGLFGPNKVLESF